MHVQERKVTRAIVLAMALSLVAVNSPRAQEQSHQDRLLRGQSVTPVFEGWEANPDGTFSMLFGYFNRNWEEQPDIPVGPNNFIEPGGQDQGQPTHFFPRRNLFSFRVKVPKDFGKQDLVWTLTVHGQTVKAYATLKPEYAVDDYLLIKEFIKNTPVFGHENKPPTVRLEGARTRTVRVGEPLSLEAVVADDGLLKVKAAPAGSPTLGGPGWYPAQGLRVSWFVYRGPADKVTFDPEQFNVWEDVKGNSPFHPGWLPPPLPPDGRFPVKVTFGAPGTFVVRVMAHDGLAITENVTVTVTQ